MVSSCPQNKIEAVADFFTQDKKSKEHKVPRSIMRASRDELDIELQIQGKLPTDIRGHVFIVGPVGTVNSGGLPLTDGSSFMNGDGMIYRLDFKSSGKVALKSRIVKPFEYFIDRATQQKTRFEKFGFRNYGLVRFSPFLGMRNELNTDFIPIQLPGESEQLLVAYDAGRPYILDTETLEVVTPIGTTKEWRAGIGLPFIFKPIFSTSYPFFDSYTQEMFSVNYGRSIKALIANIPTISKIITRINFFLTIVKKIGNFLQKIFPSIQKVLKKIESWDDFVYLIRWRGSGQLERWKLVCPDGTPIKIEQSVHQIGVTEDYVILVDTSFSTGLAQLLSNTSSNKQRLNKILRKFLEKAPSPDTSVYIVNRNDLKGGRGARSEQTEVQVIARKVVIPREIIHFLVDYENPENKIVIHASHMCAWNVSEWLRPYDTLVYYPHNRAPSKLYGMEQNPMDVSCMGRYIIDGKDITTTPLQAKTISDKRYTWGAGLYAYRDKLPSGLFPKRLENIYWTTFGLWKELTNQFLFELYKDYKYRQLPQSELKKLAEMGIPAGLLRLETASMEIADYYQCPPGHLLASPQFIPCDRENSESTDGYLSCTAFFQDTHEIWIFDAKNLEQGPICKLSHPELSFSFTLHTAWLPQIGRYKGSYQVSYEQDYRELVENYPFHLYLSRFKKELKELFEQEFYPYFKEKQKETENS